MSAPPIGDDVSQPPWEEKTRPKMPLHIPTASELADVSKEGSPHTFLVAIDDDHVIFRAPLPASGSVVVGRAQNAEIRLQHQAISRQHAKIYIDGDRFEIEDLASANGTKLGDVALKPSTRTALCLNEVVELGGVLVILQQASNLQRPVRLLPYGYFEIKLEEACQKSRASHRPFVVARFHAPAFSKNSTKASSKHPDAYPPWLEAFHETCALASFAPEQYIALFDTHTIAQAQDLIQRACPTPNISPSFVAYPQDGQTAQALLSQLQQRASVPKQASPKSDAAHFEGIVVSGKEMIRIHALADKVAQSDISVLLLGETGVGKEVLAQRIHAQSPRSQKPMLALNCAAFTAELLESELFGHHKGAFTGASQDKPGLFESAQGGTVFLDELGDMPLSTQVKLLRVLEERQVLRVGGRRPIPIDIRIVAATHHPIDKMMEARTFRQDLYYRLNGISITIPPLRKRQDELFALAEFFAERFSATARRTHIARISQQARVWMQNYPWPGNIRELRNVIERAILLGEGEITLEHLPTEKAPTTALPPVSSPPEQAPNDQTQTQTQTLPEQEPAPFENEATLKSEVAALERKRLADALKDAAGNQTAAAQALQISRSTLIRRLERYGIPRPQKKKR